MQTEILESLDARGAGLRVEFIWQGDRFGHVISRVQPGGIAQPFFESMEGAAMDDWPASPPLQSHMFHKLPTGQSAALLVGMAGRSHWSASVETSPNSAKLVFDIACRHTAQPAWLGSRYRVIGDSQQATLVAEDAQISFTVEIATIEPKMTDKNLPTTRWRYAIVLALTELH